MSRKGENRPETILAYRSLETGESLRDGDLLSRVEGDGDGRVVRVIDGAGVVCCTVGRFPPSDTRNRLLPDWAPFIPAVELVTTEREGSQLIVCNLLSGPPEVLLGAAARLMDTLEGVGLERKSLMRPDGSVDRERLAIYAHSVQEELPPGVMSELKTLWSGGGTDTGQLDRAWQALRSWYIDRGWEIEDRKTGAPQAGVRMCQFSKGSERHDATASSVMGMQHIMVSATSGE